MIEFDHNNATIYDVITHVAKVANSPTMFGDQWRINDTTRGDHVYQVSFVFHDGKSRHEATVNFVLVNKRFCVGYADQECLHRVQYFVDRLNGCKRDDEGNMQASQNGGG